MNYQETLKNLREENNIKQKDIAEKLNISSKLYNMYENQEKIIPSKYLELLCNIFDISTDYLFGLAKNKNYQNTSNINTNISNIRLKNFREENKLTQVELANLLNTTQSVICDYEKNKRLIATPFLYTICKKYKISADYLLGKIDFPKYLK